MRGQLRESTQCLLKILRRCGVRVLTWPALPYWLMSQEDTLCVGISSWCACYMWLCLSSHTFTGYIINRDICTASSVIHWLCNIHLVSLAHSDLLFDVWVCLVPSLTFPYVYIRWNFQWFASCSKKLLSAVHNFVHLNLALSLLCAYIVFVSGVEPAVGNTVSLNLFLLRSTV